MTAARKWERREADYYPTPAKTTRTLLEQVALPGGDWLEPSAGDGAIIRAVNAVRSDVRWWVRELRPECATPLHALGVRPVFCDFLAGNYPVRNCAVALGNPPFSLAQEFVEKALEQADQVVFLLRLAFLESKKRKPFFAKVGTPDVYVLAERPSFTGTGTDSAAYAWMRWHRTPQVRGAEVRILYPPEHPELFAGVISSAVDPDAFAHATDRNDSTSSAETGDRTRSDPGGAP